MSCPCKSERSYAECCEPYIQGTKVPVTAIDLMRSRYTAYVKAEIDYLVDTHAERTRGDVDRRATEQWAKESEWLGLSILASEGGGEGEDSGTVEFRAMFRARGVVRAHHERAQFERIDGRWQFVDGEMVKGEPIRREAPKVGRNDPCPCGSGKKYKKCCGAAA